ncbi:MAG: hypothetical protein ACK56I_17870, partial [bacterium]
AIRAHFLIPGAAENAKHNLQQNLQLGWQCGGFIIPPARPKSGDKNSARGVLRKFPISGATDR